ncbi:LCP family protein [Kitasatospora sp. NPDC002227]|uniref:LCP family protein n=1 Tax=Kitasatospora sp. NPDC002227 TaxID=3154773 RepID=UPI003331E77E
MTGGDEEFETRLSAAFGQAAVGLGPAEPVVLLDGAMAAGRRRKRGRRTVLLAGAMTLAVAAGASALTLPSGLPGRTSGALAAASASAPPPLDHGVTVLLVGLDSTTDAQGRPAPADLRSGELHISNDDVDTADTLILLHIPPGGGSARQLSVPRDVLVDTGDGGQVTVNKVYTRAEAVETTRLRGLGVTGPDLRWRAREAGRTALIRSVQQLAGVPVDHFAEISMTGFYRVAQAVGPVPVCLNHAVDDHMSGARLPAGRSQLGPAQALAFVRQRHGIVGDGSDLQRTYRAQAFLAGVLQKLRSGGVLADPARLSTLYDALKDDLVVDQGWNPADFVRQVPAFAQGRSTASTLPIRWQGEAAAAKQGEAKDILTAEPTTAPAGGEVPCVD